MLWMTSLLLAYPLAHLLGRYNPVAEVWRWLFSPATVAVIMLYGTFDGAPEWAFVLACFVELTLVWTVAACLLLLLARLRRLP